MIVYGLYAMYFGLLVALLAMGFFLPFLWIPLAALLLVGVLVLMSRRGQHGDGDMDVPPGAPGEPPA